MRRFHSIQFRVFVVPSPTSGVCVWAMCVSVGAAREPEHRQNGKSQSMAEGWKLEARHCTMHSTRKHTTKSTILL